MLLLAINLYSKKQSDGGINAKHTLSSYDGFTMKGTLKKKASYGEASYGEATKSNMQTSYVDSERPPVVISNWW